MGLIKKQFLRTDKIFQLFCTWVIILSLTFLKCIYGTAELQLQVAFNFVILKEIILIKSKYKFNSLMYIISMCSHDLTSGLNL